MVSRIIRNNKKSETTMINLINDHSTSAWKMSTVELFLSYRHRELETVSMITKEANNDVVLEESGNGNGNKCLFQHQFTIQFTLNVLPNPNVTDEYLKSPHKYSEEHKWYWNEQLVSLSGARHLYFMNFYKHNKPNKELSVCYLIKLKKASTVRANSVVAIEEENYDDNEDVLELKKEKELSKRVRIDVIKAGRKIVKNLRPPRKLAVPDTVEVDYNTIYFSLNYGRNVSRFDAIKPSAKNTIKIVYAYDPMSGGVDDPKNITAIQRVKPGARDKTRIRLRNLRPATKYFISLHVAYDFGDDPDSTMFAVMTPECASPKLKKPMDLHIKMNEITLMWTKPSNCDPETKPTLSYKIVYKKLNFSRILGDDDTADIRDANTMIVDGNIDGKPVESTTLKGLESLQEYLITIEAVVSNKTISQPPPPKIIINNQRSMQVVWTKPKPPEKLTVDQIGDSSWNITWKAIETDIDESRILYNLKINELTIANKSECPYDSNLPGGHLPEGCRYTSRNVTFHETLKTGFVSGQMPLCRVYQFAIKVKTPYGESEYSTSVIKELDIGCPSTTTKDPNSRYKRIDIDEDDNANPITAERVIEDLSETLFVGQGKGNTYV